MDEEHDDLLIGISPGNWGALVPDWGCVQGPQPGRGRTTPLGSAIAADAP